MESTPLFTSYYLNIRGLFSRTSVVNRMNHSNNEHIVGILHGHWTLQTLAMDNQIFNNTLKDHDFLQDAISEWPTKVV